MECKLLHWPLEVLIIKVCMPLQCIVFFGLICSQHAIEMDLVSQKAPKNPDSKDSSPISVSLKTKNLFKFFLHRTQPEQSISFSVYDRLITANIQYYGSMIKGITFCE